MTKYAVAPMELPAVEIADSDESSPSDGYTVWAGTTPNMPAKWVLIPIAIRHFSS